MSVSNICISLSCMYFFLYCSMAFLINIAVSIFVNSCRKFNFLLHRFDFGQLPEVVDTAGPDARLGALSISPLCHRD